MFLIDPTSVAVAVRTLRDSPHSATTKSQDLLLMLLECTPRPLSSQQFSPGHITCSGLVFGADHKRILLVHHRRFDRWLLPGGHVEPDDKDIWETGRREVIEETGAVFGARRKPSSRRH